VDSVLIPQLIVPFRSEEFNNLFNVPDYPDGFETWTKSLRKILCTCPNSPVHCPVEVPGVSWIMRSSQQFSTLSGMLGSFVSSGGFKCV
jgi:hypothetical protein